MLSLANDSNEPSALLSDARLTIATLIQRPSTITTSNAFDEFAVLDRLIDVSNDVDRSEDGESRKFLNIAQLISASTCIYSRRVDALYKLINTFQSTSEHQRDESISNKNSQSESVLISKQEEQQSKTHIKKQRKQTHRSFICNDLTKINLTSSKQFFLDRTSLLDLKLFQKHVPIGNRSFWTNDTRPVIFDLLFNDQSIEIKQEYQQQESEQLIDTFDKLSPILHESTSNNNDILVSVPTYDDQDLSWNDEKLYERKKANKNRRRKVKHGIGLNIFRNGPTDEQQEYFRLHKMKSLSNRVKTEQTHFFIKKLNQLHFNRLIKDCPPSTISNFVYPTITIQHLTIRERYSRQHNQPYFPVIRSPPVPISDVLNENAQILPLSSPPSPPVSAFIDEFNDDIQDIDIHLQTDMERILDAAIYHSNEEQEQNRIFTELRSSIMSYMNRYNAIKRINLDDLLESLNDNYSLPLIFSQLLHLCASTQRYYLRSISDHNLFIENII